MQAKLHIKMTDTYKNYNNGKIYFSQNEASNYDIFQIGCGL